MNIVGVYYSKASYENSIITIDVSFTLYQLVPKNRQNFYCSLYFLQCVYLIDLSSDFESWKLRSTEIEKFCCRWCNSVMPSAEEVALYLQRSFPSSWNPAITENCIIGYKHLWKGNSRPAHFIKARLSLGVTIFRVYGSYTGKRPDMDLTLVTTLPAVNDWLMVFSHKLVIEGRNSGLALEYISWRF